jgi:hypothetical protein
MRYSQQEREAIIRESRALLAEDWQRGKGSPLDSPVVSEPIVETVKERHRREIAERDREWERERARDAGTRSQHELATNRISSIEAQVLEVARGTNQFAEAAAAEMAELRAENVTLSAKVARLEIEIGNLQAAKRSRKTKPSGEIIDLPSVRVAAQ